MPKISTVERTPALMAKVHAGNPPKYDHYEYRDTMALVALDGKLYEVTREGDETNRQILIRMRRTIREMDLTDRVDIGHDPDTDSYIVYPKDGTRRRRRRKSGDLQTESVEAEDA